MILIKITLTILAILFAVKSFKYMVNKKNPLAALISVFSILLLLLTWFDEYKTSLSFVDERLMNFINLNFILIFILIAVVVVYFFILLYNNQKKIESDLTTFVRKAAISRVKDN